MEDEKLKELDAQIMDAIEQNGQALYTTIMEKVMEATKNPSMDKALEDARTKTSFTVTEDDIPEPSTEQLEPEEEEPEETTEPEITMNVLTNADIERMKLKEQGGLDENTKGNVESLQSLAYQQKQRQQNVKKQQLPDLESRKAYLLKIIDQKFARQSPIDCEHVRETVLSYRLITDPEYEEVMLSFIKEGMVKKVNDTNWFFMATPAPAPLPVVEEKEVVEDEQQEIEETEPVEEETPEDEVPEEDIERSKIEW